MDPISVLPKEQARSLRGVLFDLDDTLLTHGSLTLQAYRALWRLKEDGLLLVGVTGRPSGWGEILARQWPVDAMITENGAIACVLSEGQPRVLDPCDAETRAERKLRLEGLVQAVRETVPEVHANTDTPLRIADTTWDVGERGRPPEEAIQRVLASIVAHGARWTRSSVHLHATFDAHDKASGAVRILGELFDEDPGSALARFVYVGDSPNDAPCFAAFHVSVGVANVRRHLGRIRIPPRYVTDRSMGEGFAEFADLFLALRA